jgi:putative peptidoglycan lipid II flippase
VLTINYAAQQSAGEGALTRYTWANAVYLLPYAVLAAPLLQLAFPRLAAAAEHGSADVRQVLAEVLPVTILAGWLGAGLLVATAVPVARVFVLGPGSGDTLALAVPIALFAPAVVGFALLGLASRTLLAQHRAREAGVTTAVAWAAVIVAVLAFGRTVPWLAGSMSAGMVVGAVIGWLLVRRSVGLALRTLARPMLGGLLAAVVGAGIALWPAWLLRDAGLLAAGAGAFGTALLCLAGFLGVLRLAIPGLFGELRALLPRPTAKAH